MRLVLATLVSCLVLTLTACSGKPSTGEMKTQFWASLQKDGMEELFSLSDFEKLNGYQKSDRVYIADLRYTLTFKKGLGEWTEELKTTSKDQPLQAFGAGLSLMAMQLQYGEFEKGDEVVQDAKITYIKTEQGWRIEQAKGLFD